MDELVLREFQAIRDLIAVNEAARERAMLVERDSRRAEKVELDARLAHMNEFRSAMSDQAARFIARPEFEEAIKAGVERYEATRDYVDSQIGAQVNPIRADVERIQRPDWTFISALGGILVAAVAGCWLIIGLEIDSKAGPLRSDLETLRTVSAQNAERLRFLETTSTASTQADTASRADRAQLNERVRQMETQLPGGQQALTEIANLKTNQAMTFERIQQLRAADTEQRAMLVEISGFLCNQDAIRSQIHSQDLRTQAMLWKRVFDQEMPIDNAFYAQVGRCSGTRGGG